MKFTEEERKYIDAELKLADEIQKLPGSRYYTMEEIMGEIRSQFNKDIRSYCK